MKSSLLFILFVSVLFGCNNSVNSNVSLENNVLKKQTDQEKEALEALTQLQINADIENSIYLTFGNTNHNQLPSDSSFMISQEKFKLVLLDYTAKHHQNIAEQKRIDWVEASVKAKTSYKVYYCRDRSKKADLNHDLPYSGAWILPSVLNKDIVMIWRR